MGRSRRLCHSGGVQIGILGPLEVLTDGAAVQVTGSRLRAVITRLAVDAPNPVSTAALVDALWPVGAPGDPTNALQSLMSRVRRSLGDAGLVQQVGDGYRLPLRRTDVDAVLFEQLVRTGRREVREGSAAAARKTLDTALQLWRGLPLADAGDAAYAAGPRARLNELRLDAQGDHVAAMLALGQPAEVLPDIEMLAAAEPFREQFTALLVRALAATGRTADALAAYERHRDRLAEELGLDPGPELQELHLSVLRGTTRNTTTDRAAPRVRRRSNVPTAVTSLIGREAEVERVTGLLDNGRLVTVTGPGGAGKTRLAAEIAHLRAGLEPDGVWLVELAPVTDEHAIAQATLGAIGLLDTRVVERRADAQSRDSTEYLLEVLAEAQCLLLIDNCEHLINPTAALIERLLANCPGVRILATSREPLGIPGEALCVLPPLELPPATAGAREALRYPAVQLLVERAMSVSRDFVVDGRTVADVIEVVRRLDGLPLAIELAAARLRVLPIAEISRRLSDRFRLLTGGSRTALPRHRTLRAVVEWSWDLLTPDERLLAERFAVFPGGATDESAAAVCADDRLAATTVPELLVALADKSLLQVIGGPQVRYRMLETIREYGMERLAERDQADIARAAHARYFLVLAGRLDPVLRTSEQLTALATIGVERDNILAALRFLGESPEPADRSAALDLALSLTWYWTMINAGNEARQWLGFALAAVEGAAHPQYIWARCAWMIAAMAAGGTAVNTTSLSDLRREVLPIAAEMAAAPPPHPGALEILHPLLWYFGDDIERADAAMRAVLQSSDPWIRAAALASRAGFAENVGDVEMMRGDIEAAHTGFEAIGDRWGLAGVLSARAHVRTLDGDLGGAIADYERAVQYSGELGSQDDLSFLRLRLAGLRIRAGDLAGARRDIEQVRDEQDGPWQGFDRNWFADGMLIVITAEEGDLDTAARLSADLHADIRSRRLGMMHGHAVTVVTAITASVAVRTGEVLRAHTDLREVYPIAVATADQPIIATFGVAVAAVAERTGHRDQAAEILGAAARLRGSDDVTDPSVGRLTASLRAAMGPRFDDSYAAGRQLDRQAAIDRVDPSLLALDEPGA
jgi:predicted ATPase/DNA-binding SARP family transcriptional activator